MKRKLAVGVVIVILLCGIVAIVSPGEETPDLRGREPPSPDGSKTPDPTRTPESTQTPRPTRTPKPTRTSRPTRTLRPTKTPTLSPVPTATLSLENRLRLAVTDNKPAGCSETPEVKYHKGDAVLGAMLEVRYEVWVLTDKIAVEDCIRSFVRTAPAVYLCDPELDILNVNYVTTFVDAYGKERQASLLRIQIKRETADKITWENMLICNVQRVVEAFKLHPSFRSMWAKRCQ